MALRFLVLCLSASALTVLSAIPASAQNSRIKRVVEPVTYYVQSPKLRIRDNPVAGSVVGLLEQGQKIKGFEQYDGWVRISKPGATERWVNVDYVTQNRVTNASYGFNGRLKRPGFGQADIPDDAPLTRIKAGDARLFAASVRALPTGNRVIITRQDFKVGPYFEKRLVACSEGAATAFQLLGEGYNYRMMETDPRNQSLLAGTPKITVATDKLSAIDSAVTTHACKAG